MTTYSLPQKTSALIFDVDGTLYSCQAYAEAQIMTQIERLAQSRDKTTEAMEAEIEAYRSAWSKEHGGKKISLGNTFVAFGISIEESIRWRDELVHPENYLSHDDRLRKTLMDLKAKFRLGVVTNNPASVGRRTLVALGIEDLFDSIVGLDTCGVSKPHEDPFLLANKELGAVPEECVSIGDRYDIDISLPLELGMGGVLVSGVEEVYLLPSLLFRG